MGNLYQIGNRAVISSIVGDLPTKSKVSLPVSSIVFGVNGNFNIETENEEINKGDCFYIAAETTYKVTPLDCKGFVIVFFDAVSPEHYFLSFKYTDRKTVQLSGKSSESLLNRAFHKLDETESCIFLDEMFKCVFDEDRRNILNAFDNRIILIDDYIRKNIREKISNKELASKVYLSESRFYHFFKEQTGVNVSRYILWLRMKAIFQRYFKSESKLSAILELANFTDFSHFIKSFRSFFGESPKRLLNK